MEPNEIPQILEAILFVAGEPVAVADLAQALEVSEMEIMHAVEELQRECERRGVTIHRYGDHLRMETRPEYAPSVERLLQPVQRQTLSQTAMETLAVIAYRQPVTKGEVEQVRGVKCDYSVQSLLHKGLIREAMAALEGVTLTAPVALGQVAVANVCGTGVNFVTTRAM